MLTSTLSISSLKPSTLRPLDLEVQIRAPQQYLKTRVYAEGLIDEAAFLLAEWLSSTAVQGRIAFPEIIVPVTVVLKRSVKNAKTGSTAGKDLALLKTLIERIEESAKWVENRRKTLKIAPSQKDNVALWEKDLQSKVEESPLARYVKVQRKAREKRQQLIEKVGFLLGWFLVDANDISYRREKENMRYWSQSDLVSSSTLFETCILMVRHKLNIQRPSG